MSRPAYRGPTSRRSENALAPTGPSDFTNVIALPANDHAIEIDVDRAATAVLLGALEVHPSSRTIFVEGAHTDLGGRAFDLLMALLEANGEILSKEVLLSHVWPGLTVVDSNLKVQLSILRRALGPERWRIKTVSGRGYMLVAHDAVSGPPTASAAVPNAKADSPLVIVVDGDRTTQELVMRALSGIAKCLDGAARLALYSGDLDDRVFA